MTVTLKKSRKLAWVVLGVVAVASVAVVTIILPLPWREIALRCCYEPTRNFGPSYVFAGSLLHTHEVGRVPRHTGRTEFQKKIFEWLPGPDMVMFCYDREGELSDVLELR